MSFVTKRERVFNEYKLYDLPARNEGKLKAYASCTDARAWSHFIADKTDHLFEIIKRNNEKCRPKYVPTEVIVDTLMMAKNNQISRLKLKVQEFERMLAAYNRLDLNEAQKSEIGKAHTTIKAANKELDDLYIDLDLSGDAEGIDSEAFGTGQSRGDEISRNTVAETTKSSVSEWSYIKEPKPERSRDEQSNNGLNTDQIDELMKQIEHSKNIGDEAKISNNEAKFCDTGTYAEEDARIEKLEDMIVTKDAKLNAMQNMIAVLESDVCEPYCIYAHIYTALEKIFAILRQNLKYKQYLDLLTLGQDIQQVHIKGKILYRIKILEKFCIALIAPCSITNKPQNCTCYRAEVLTGYETTYAVSATESSQNIIEKKRAHLIADIIDVDEIKEAMDDQSLHKSESDTATEFFDIEESNAENKSKFLIKNLQSSYSKLVTCYEILKSEKDLLYVRCQELLKVDEENESLRNSMKDYNNLWNEMEYFRQRSESLDKLKAKYYILLNETTNLESKFVAESEKNKIKSDTINELRDENLLLDKKLTESSLAHEKEINFLIFKMKEIECAKMCKEQQIKSLSNDMEKYLNKNYVENDYLQINEVLDRMAKEKDQIYFEETCNCKNVKIDHLQQEINNNLAYINELKLEVEKWEKKYDDAVYTIGMLNNEIRITNTKNHELSEKNIEKSNAIDNLHNILQNKSEQIEILNEELERQESKNVLISMEINRSQHSFTSQFPLIIENELQIRNNQNTNVYEYKKNESFATKEECVLSHENSYTDSVEIFPDYTENIEQTLLYVPERESVAIEKLRHDLDKYTSDDDMQYKIQNRSQEIDKSERIPSIHKYAKDISIEISKIENDLKERLSLLENEQKNFLEYSAETDNEFMFMTNNTYDSKDNHTSSSTNCNHDDLLSQIKLLRQQSTATIAKCDDIKEQYKKSLSLTKKEIAELRNVTLKPNDINNVDDTFNKMIQDTFKENKNLTEQLKQKNNETKELLADINKMRINFQDKIMTLETEKHKLLNSIKESSNKNAFISRFSENNNLLPNEPQSSDVNNEQKDVQSQFKLLRDESSAKINTYDNVKEIYKKSLEISKNESDDLKSQITHISNISKRSEELMSKYNKLLHEKNILQNELCEKTDELSNVKNNFQQVHCQVKELEPFKQKYELLYTETENKLMDKEAEINELRKTNNLLENDIKKFTTLTIEDLKGKINYLELLCDGIKVDKEEMKTKLEEEKKYLKDIKQQLESTEKENNDLVSQITNLKIDNNAMKNCISLLENNILIMQSQLDSLNKIITEKDDELLDLKKIYTKFTEVQIYNDVIKKENMKLQQNLKICNEEFRTLEDENKVVNILNHNILSEMEAIKTELNIKKEEITRTNLSFRDIKEEIEEIKAEKSCDNERELDLLNKLQICEQIINKLKEDLSERNSSISELQNHINNLQEEIKNLHENLETAIDNSEKRTQEDIEDIDESVKKVKAHYTKATHNIKPEITKLQDINERLNLLKLGTKEADIEKEKRISRINCLENERETVIHNLNQLEVAVLGLCNLSNKSCTIDIIDVLHNIQKAYEDKNASNDKTIQNSQISYHLLKTKAEEAQKIAEIERLNIINEKKNNEHNRLNFQAIIQDLNNQLYKKDITHEDIIKDLESKLSDQQNLFDQILDSKENHIENLKNELTKLMEIHEKSLTEVNVLRQKLKVSKDHNNLQSLQINKLYIDYQTRCTEVKMLQKLVQDLNKASSNNIGLQTSFEINKTKQNIKTNDSMTNTDDLISLSNMDKNELMINKKGKGSFISEASSVKKKEIVEKIFVEPSVDIVKSRLEKFETKLLEQYSICTLMCDTDLNDPDLQNFNTNNPLKYRDSVNIISSTKANDLISHICDGKKTQTVNNKEVKEITNPELENKFSLGNISLPHKQSAKNNLNNYLRKQEIEFLPKKKNSQTESSAKDLMSEKKNVIFTANKKSEESLGDAVNYITSEGVQNIQSTKVSYNYNSQSHLNLHSKSLDDLSKSGKIKHQAFQKPLVNSYKKKEAQIINETKSNTNTYDTESQNDLLFESKLITNLQDHTNNENDIIVNNLEKNTLRKSRSYEQISEPYGYIAFEENKSNLVLSTNLARPIRSSNERTLEELNTLEMFKNKIKSLSKALAESDNEHLKKIEAIKYQYGNHIKCIINEHNKGVVSIQTLHEETLNDVIKIHDIEIENIRALSIEAMTKNEKLEKENKKLRIKMELREFNHRPVKLADLQKRKSKSRTNPSYLTKTDVEAFNVKPKRKSTVSCACAMNINVSDAIHNIFEQVDKKNKKMAEETYLKYIADKLMDGIEHLNPRELSFLHSKVCRFWKTIRNKDKAVKGETDSLEQELVNLGPHPKQNAHEPYKVINDRRPRRCHDRGTANCNTLPVENEGTSQDTTFYGSKKKKICCGCVYDVKYKDGLYTSRTRKK